MLQAQKESKLEELLGEVQGEEEPEGVPVAGPSGETAEYSSGNTFCCFFSNHFSNHNPWLVCEFSYGNILLGFSLIPWLVSLADESDEGEESRGETKEEQELGVVKSWMEVGGLPALAEEEAQGLLCEVYLFHLVWFSF